MSQDDLDWTELESVALFGQTNLGHWSISTQATRGVILDVVHAQRWALGKLWRLPEACKEEAECARTYARDATVVVDLKQNIEWCTEDFEFEWHEETPDDVRNHPAFEEAEHDVVIRAALRASGPRLEFATQGHNRVLPCIFNLVVCDHMCRDLEER
mgnify:CR=1 FL=1